MSAKVLANLAGWEKTFKDVLIPDLPEVNAQAEQRKAIAGNLEALPEATQLAAGLNKFNFEQLQSMLKMAIPGYDEIMGTGSKQIASMLKGDLPQDVQEMIQRSRGARSFAGGYGGSGMAGAAEAKDIGLGSLDIIREGFSHAERWIQSARLPQLADVSAMFRSPEKQIADAYTERNNRFNYDFLKAKQAAMPTGTERALTGLTDWVEGILASAATMGISNVMGGGGPVEGAAGGMGGTSMGSGGGALGMWGSGGGKLGGYG